MHIPGKGAPGGRNGAQAMMCIMMRIRDSTVQELAGLYMVLGLF
jgi:hypothetical protein